MEKQDEIGGDTAKASHTPGPWYGNPVCLIPGATHSGRDWQVLIAHIGTGSGVVAVAHGSTAREAEANANIIKAAPDLLLAAQRIQAYFDNEVTGEYESAMRRQLRAAIAKASEQQ